MKFQNVKPITQIREEQKIDDKARIAQLEQQKAALELEVNRLNGQNETLKAQVVQVNADLMGFMEFYFSNA